MFTAELIKSSPWLVHASRHQFFDPIKATGLKRSNPWKAEGVWNQIGDDERNFICLKPLLSQNDTTPTYPGYYFFMAIDAADLAGEFGVDTSFDPNRAEFDRLKQSLPAVPEEAHLVSIGLSYGSIVYFNAIPPVLLRVRLIESDAVDPTDWPFLLDTSIKQVFFEWRGNKIDHEGNSIVPLGLDI